MYKPDRGQLLPDEYLSGRISEAVGVGTVRALIYARVSHEDSALSDLSIPQQVAACREECARREWEVVGIYQDAGKSAYNDSAGREGFQELIRAAVESHSGAEPVTRIVVDKLDRFSRDEEVNITYKRRLLPQYGIQVFSLAERFEGGGGTSRAMERISEAFAIQQSEDIARNTMRALAENAQQGHSCGGRVPWGYRAEKKTLGTDSRGNEKTRTDWLPDEALRADVHRLFGLLAEGYGVHRVAAMMNAEGRPSPSGGKWGRPTVYDLARRVYVYEGVFVWNMGHIVEWHDDQGRKRKTHRLKDPRTWVRREGAYAPLITPAVAAAVRQRFPLQLDSPEMYERQARKLADRHRKDGGKRGGHSTPTDGIPNRTRGTEWLLTGLAVCGDCGAGLVSYTASRRRKDGSRWRAYRCGAFHRTGGTSCRGYYVPAERAEQALLDAVTERLADRFAARDALGRIAQVAGAYRKALEQRLTAVEAEAAQADERILEVVNHGLAGGIDAEACNLKIRTIREETAALQEKARNIRILLEGMGSAMVRAQDLLRSAAELPLIWDALSADERRQRLHELVSLMVVEKGEQGDVAAARIHFRTVLGSQNAQKQGLRLELSEKGAAGENKRPGAENSLRAETANASQRCWLRWEEADPHRRHHRSMGRFRLPPQCRRFRPTLRSAAY